MIFSGLSGGSDLVGAGVALVAMAVRLTSKGPALYGSDRVGWNNVTFKMPKFRSMRVGKPAVATHLLVDARSH
ncbi:sugar transferase [Limnohabitans sp. Rim8]|uniref:sugar transferase n=1 Tax=Limnohabitans sp. Rim8 TaxID=1100718 RepID=UPI0033059F50